MTDRRVPVRSVSVVIATHNEGTELLSTVLNLARELPSTGEIIVVNDMSSDGSVAGLAGHVANIRLLRPPRRLGVAGARNLGAKEAHGDVLIFADAHVRAPSGWLGSFLRVLADEQVGAAGPAIARMRHPEVRGYGLRFTDSATNLEWLGPLGADPYPVPVLGGFFIGMRREVFNLTGGLDGGMHIYGMEDPELCLRLWTLGYRCMLIPTVIVRHVFRTKAHQLDWQSGLHNVLRLGVLHFGTNRLRALFGHYAGDCEFPDAMARLLDSDVAERRAWIRARRVADDEWFFSYINDVSLGTARA
jgi:GT2 family glycosyltransferase